MIVEEEYNTQLLYGIRQEVKRVQVFFYHKVIEIFANTGPVC